LKILITEKDRLEIRIIPIVDITDHDRFQEVNLIQRTDMAFKGNKKGQQRNF